MSETIAELLAIQLTKQQAEIDRLQATLKRLHKLFAHIEGINDERDSVPILLEARRIVEDAIRGQELEE